MNRSQLKNLMNMPMFNADAVREVLTGGGNYVDKYFESIIRDDEYLSRSAQERFEVLEFWGFVDREIIEKYDVDIPKELRDVEQLNVNVWILGITRTRKQ